MSDFLLRKWLSKAVYDLTISEFGGCLALVVHKLHIPFCKMQSNFVNTK